MARADHSHHRLSCYDNRHLKFPIRCVAITEIRTRSSAGSATTPRNALSGKDRKKPFAV